MKKILAFVILGTALFVIFGIALTTLGFYAGLQTGKDITALAEAVNARHEAIQGLSKAIDERGEALERAVKALEPFAIEAAKVGPPKIDWKELEQCVHSNLDKATAFCAVYHNDGMSCAVCPDCGKYINEELEQ